MRRQKEAPETDAEIDMTPMLDVVFIMLIFFIVTAVFVKESGVDVEKPTAVTAKSIKRVSILIGITEDSKVWVNKKEVEVGDVRAVVEKLKRENPQGNVVIQADEESQSGVVVDVMDQLAQAGVAGVAIATEKGE